MMIDVFVIVNRETGRPVRNRAYLNVRDAKLALKCHYGSRLASYAVAKLSASPSVLVIADESGKWTEVSAE